MTTSDIGTGEEGNNIRLSKYARADETKQQLLRWEEAVEAEEGAEVTFWRKPRPPGRRGR